MLIFFFLLNKFVKNEEKNKQKRLKTIGRKGNQQ